MDIMTVMKATSLLHIEQVSGLQLLEHERRESLKCPELQWECVALLHLVKETVHLDHNPFIPCKVGINFSSRNAP